MEEGHKYFFIFPKIPWHKEECKHEWILVWLSTELEGFRCKLCGEETLDFGDENE